MNLSGKYIKGTGSYVVKEIAPPSVQGELVTNGDFSTDTDWTKGTGWTIADGVAHCDGSGGSFSYISNNCTIDNGGAYLIKYEVSAYASGSLIISSASFGSTVNLDESVGVHEIVIVSSKDYTNITIGSGVQAFIGSIDNVSVQEVPQGYPLLDKGTKYLECTTAGTVAFPSTQAYGEWEFDLYKAGDGNLDRIYFINQNTNIYPDAVGYYLQIFSNEAVYFGRVAVGVLTTLFNTSVSATLINTWYRFKITRTLDGQWYLYIKGGAFGTNDWTLISATGGFGTNPLTDNTHKESQYFVMDLDTGDRIANIKLTEGVVQ